MPPSRLYAFLSTRWWLTFLLMGVSFVLFGLVSLNLLQLLIANLGFLAQYGLYALREGALLQLLELAVSGYAAAAFYLLFKLCEKVLVDRLSNGTPAAAPAPTEEAPADGEVSVSAPARSEGA